MEIQDSSEKCRICFTSPGDFNIFTDELYLNEQQRNVLIFKALNFFCNEKLYTPDDLSSLICDLCSNELYGAYIFILKIQKSESEQQFKRNQGVQEQTGSSKEPNQQYESKVITHTFSPKTELEKTGFILIDGSNKTASVIDIEDPIDMNQMEEATKIDSDYDAEDTLEILDVISNDSEEEKTLTFIQTSEVENTKSNPLSSLVKNAKRPGEKLSNKVRTKRLFTIPSFIVIPKISYESNPELDDDPKKRVFYLSVKPTIVERQHNGFLIEDPSLLDSMEEPDVLFKCKFCIKAFSTASYLLIHVRKSHLCGNCLKCFKSYQELNLHVKTVHTLSTCPYCNDKTFTSTPSYRYHLKKSHQLVLPPYMSLISMDDKEELCEMDC